MIGVLKIVLAVLGYLQLVMTVLYLNGAFQTEVRQGVPAAQSLKQQEMILLRVFSRDTVSE